MASKVLKGEAKGAFPRLCVGCIVLGRNTCSQSSSESRAEFRAFQAIILPNHRVNRYLDNMGYLIILSYNMSHIPDLPWPPNLWTFCVCVTPLHELSPTKPSSVFNTRIEQGRIYQNF
jgi:hypothetical protein